MHGSADRVEIADATARLRSSGWLSRQPAGFQQAIVAIIVWRKVEAGAAVIIAGDADGGLWGVASGLVDLTSALSTADSPPSHIGHPGSWWGPAPAFGRSRNSSVTARTTALLALVPQGALEALLAANPGWWRCVGDLAVELMELALGSFADLLIRDSRLRCVAVLLRVAGCRFGPPPPPGEITVPLAQDEFAAMTNLSRGSAGGVLRELEAEGLIGLGYRHVTLFDPLRLRQLLDD
jgi:CRP-like cAMP-binding protein